MPRQNAGRVPLTHTRTASTPCVHSLRDKVCPEVAPQPEPWAAWLMVNTEPNTVSAKCASSACAPLIGKPPAGPHHCTGPRRASAFVFTQHGAQGTGHWGSPMATEQENLGMAKNSFQKQTMNSCKELWTLQLPVSMHSQGQTFLKGWNS